MIGSLTGTSPAGLNQSRQVRIAMETLTLVMLMAPPVWLAFHWPYIPTEPSHLRHSRMFLWVMPAFALVVYLFLSEFGLLSRMHILRSGHRLSGLKPIFRNYILTTRLELLAFFAVLSLAMDQEAMTGHLWVAKGFISASIVVIVCTIAIFTVLAARASYRLVRPVPQL